MMRIAFDWDPAKAGANLDKHGVSFDRAIAVFADPLQLSTLDADHDEAEERWVTLGLVETQLLVVVPTWREDPTADLADVRIISARHPTRNERRQYEEGPET